MQADTRRARHRPVTAHDTRTAEHRLGKALGQWQHWQTSSPPGAAPEVEQALDGGLSNFNFLVHSAGQRFVVRIDGVHPGRHGLSRSAEWQILRSAWRAGIAPEPCYFNPELGVLVCRYLPADTLQAHSLADLAILLRCIHALPARHYRLDLAERVARYHGQLRHGDLPALPAGHLHAIEHCLAQSSGHARRVLCHNDLIAANLLRSGGRLYALDWEYSAMGDPWFDLAGAALGQDLAAGEDTDFLGHYLGASPDPAQRAALQGRRVLCRYIELLWYLLEAPESDASAVLALRLPLLEQELARLT
ncbi:choline kinase family protein [Haliea sp. E17]|uniref:choline kinase family protein n=1 Tax=Haliea sp. E17 TaxID=3401576 RepID=UPI003AAA89EF